MASRRSTLVSLAAGTLSLGIGRAGQGEVHQESPHQHEDVVEKGTGPHPPPRQPIFLTGPEVKLVSCLAELIVPRTDTPGALDAGVPWSIDRRLSTSSVDQQREFRTALTVFNSEAQLRGKQRFVELGANEQTEILTSCSQQLDTARGKAFQLIKSLTLDAYYRSREGLVEELGFKGNTFRTSFPGCTHPEHQIRS